MVKQAQAPALAVAREQSQATDPVIELSTGYKARLVPVAGFLLTKVATRIQDPEIPMWPNPDKEGKLEPNPSDPAYLWAVAAADRERTEAVMDAIVLFGVEIQGELPPVGNWLPKLQKMVALGHLDLDGFNVEDPLDQEFLFKRYIAVGAGDMEEVMRRSGITQAMISEAAKSFRRDEVRGAD